MTFSADEKERYQAQFNLPNFGTAAQEKLKAARVLCVGAGGLGSPAVLYLTAAGIGSIGIIDADTVSISNLQRQILYNESQLGQAKVNAAAQTLTGLNANTEITTYAERLDHENAIEIISKYDIILDGSDNFETHYLINDACYFSQRPFVHGSAQQYAGQYALFQPNDTPCYRCIFPDATAAGEDCPACQDAGVLGTVPGLVGTSQANIVIQWICQKTGPIQNKFFQLNTETHTINSIQLKADPNCSLCGKNPSITDLKKEKTASTELSFASAFGPQRDKISILDVRNAFEIKSSDPKTDVHIPLDELPSRYQELNEKKSWGIVCQHGIRSQHAAQFLSQHGFKDARSVQGGMAAAKS